MQYRTINGVDVFEVGKQQLWDWCDWQFAGYNPKRRLECYADSLAKGLYVVVEGYAKFGRIAHKSSVVTSTRSLRAALNIVMDYVSAEQNIPFDGKGQLYAHEYEVWHIVDDCELYDDWCALAAASLQYDADIEWALDDIALAGAPVCALCGDSWGGPWVMRGGVTSGRYWLCEDCDERVRKIVDNYCMSGVRAHV